VQACSKHTNRILLCAEFDEVPSLAIRVRGRSINHLPTPEGVVRNRPRSTTSPSWWSAQEWLQTSPRSIWIVFSWEQSLRSEEPAHPVFRQLWLGLDLLDRGFIDNPLVQIGVTDSLAATIPKKRLRQLRPMVFHNRARDRACHLRQPRSAAYRSSPVAALYDLRCGRP
jgi:hypothetical protein